MNWFHSSIKIVSMLIQGWYHLHTCNEKHQGHDKQTKTNQLAFSIVSYNDCKIRLTNSKQGKKVHKPLHSSSIGNHKYNIQTNPLDFFSWQSTFQIMCLGLFFISYKSASIFTVHILQHTNCLEVLCFFMDLTDQRLPVDMDCQCFRPFGVF